MAAQQRNKFCLAAALFGFPPADGYAEPTQQVPDSWLRLFEERADDKLRAGLAMSCKAGRAYYTPDQMVVSGPDGSKVVTFTIDDSFGSLTSTASLAKAAGKRHADVVELVLRRAPRARRVRLVQAVVDQVLGCFASTLRVDLDSALYEPFPSPSQLPKLRTLSICTSAGSTISSLAAHTQLTSLQLYYEMSEYQAGYVPPFPLILLPGPTAYALCHLTTNENLDNQLLSLLTQRTPSLTHLTVHELALTHSAASSEWGVVQLNLTDDGGHDIEAEQLIWLPKQRGGVVLTVTTELLGVCFEEITEQGIPSDFLARLPWWRLEVWKVSVMIDESWSLDDHFRVVPTLQEQLRGYVTCAARSDLELHVEDNPGTYYNTTSLEPNMRPDFHVYNDLTDDILSGLLRWDSLEIFE